MAIGSTHGSTDTEEKLASHSISDAYGSQQSDKEEEEYTEREEKGAADREELYKCDLNLLHVGQDLPSYFVIIYRVCTLCCINRPCL
jgi:hypothetical protein